MSASGQISRPMRPARIFAKVCFSRTVSTAAAEMWRARHLPQYRAILTEIAVSAPNSCPWSWFLEDGSGELPLLRLRGAALGWKSVTRRSLGHAIEGCSPASEIQSALLGCGTDRRAWPGRGAGWEMARLEITSGSTATTGRAAALAKTSCSAEPGRITCGAGSETTRSSRKTGSAMTRLRAKVSARWRVTR